MAYKFKFKITWDSLLAIKKVGRINNDTLMRVPVEGEYTVDNFAKALADLESTDPEPSAKHQTVL